MPLSAEKLANLKSFHEQIKSPKSDGSTPNAPLLLAVEPTTRCNFNCVHCSQAVSQPPIDMSPELFRSIVPALRTAVELYLFGDGEVLLAIPLHLAMISRVYREDPECELGFSTNGKLLTPEVYELYSTAGVHHIQISVDAGTAELYNTMRKGGSFEELLANMDGISALRRRSKAIHPKLYLATVISRQNYRQLPALAEFAKRFEFSYWYINVECPQRPGRDLLSMTSEDLLELQCIREDIMRDYGSYYMILFDSSIGLTAGTSETRFGADSSVFCTAPWQRFELKANGDVRVCPYYHKPIGSMNGRTFDDVWNGKEFRELRRVFRSRTGIPSCCLHCRLSMKRLYSQGSPGIPNTRHLGMLARMGRRVSAMREQFIAG